MVAVMVAVMVTTMVTMLVTTTVTTMATTTVETAGQATGVTDRSEVQGVKMRGLKSRSPQSLTRAISDGLQRGAPIEERVVSGGQVEEDGLATVEHGWQPA
jgi:hypothetical protein